MHDEGLSAKEAVDAVLRENLFGLEIDPRCTQIAAFALAMAAWKFPDENGEPLGYRPLPPLNIACSGQGVVGTKDDWARFAGGDGKFREGMERLYDLFQRAPDLGSLLDPRTVTEDLFSLGFETLKGTVERTLKKIEAREDPDRAAIGVAAQGVAFAASLMAREFDLIATNVPYLKGERHEDSLKLFLEQEFPVSKGDLATVFVERGLELCKSAGTLAVVAPQAWLFLTRRATLRRKLLSNFTWQLLARLGPGAFGAISGEVVNVVLLLLKNTPAKPEQFLHEVDASEGTNPLEKSQILMNAPLKLERQAMFLTTPDCRVVSTISTLHLLGEYCEGLHGQSTFDSGCFEFKFWELDCVSNGWVRQQSTTNNTCYYSGCSGILRWENGSGLLANLMEAKKAEGYTSGAWRAGVSSWGKLGVLISQIDNLCASIYTGVSFDSNVAAVIPQDGRHLPAVWAFCSSPDFAEAVRTLDKKLNVTNSTLVKVPFDLDRWQQVAAEEYPNGLPEPHSDDPTQWLFEGHPVGSTDPLHVAVARLLGYRWPDQEPDDLDALADKDGIVSIPATRGEPPAADRLREVLRAAFGSSISFSPKPGPSRARRSTIGSSTASSSSIAGGSTSAPSSGTSGTDARTALLA